MNRIWIIAGGIVAVIAIGYYLWWGGKITTLEVQGNAEFEESLNSTISSCVQDLKGKSFWLISDKQVIERVKRCDVMINDVAVKTSFPQKMVVTVAYHAPVAKLPLQTECELVTSAAIIIKIPTDRCALYTVPVVKGVSSLMGNPLTQFIQILATELKKQSISASELEYKGDLTNSWIIIRLKTQKTVYVPVSSELTQKVALLKASLVGLEEAKEKYTIIDLRFDRVVYK